MLGLGRILEMVVTHLRRHQPFWFCARACEGGDEEGFAKDAATWEGATETHLIERDGRGRVRRSARRHLLLGGYLLAFFGLAVIGGWWSCRIW